MALPYSSVTSTSEYAAQRGMERQVLTLLHRARNPRALAASPLMGAVCREMRTRNPVAALERVVLTVLAGDDESAMRQRDAIFEVDFKRATTNSELARRSGVSRRHFQRRRAEAIAAIARYARTIVARPHSEAPSAQSATAAAARRFERERSAFLLARDRGAVLEMRAIAGNLLRVAENRAARVLAMECRADANVRLGRQDEATEHLDCLSPSARLLVLARLSLLAHNADEAQECARAALRAMGPEDRERYLCLTVVAQASLLRRVPWRLPVVTPTLPLCSWERIAMEVEQARHCALGLEWSDAQRLARSTQRRADVLGYHELTARSAAVLHASAAARGDIEQLRRWRADAVSHLLPTQDRVLATGLFIFSAYNDRLGMDPWLNRVLYERLGVVVPQMLGENESQRAAVHDLLAAFLDAAVAGQNQSPRLETAFSKVARSDSALGHYADKLREPICEMLALAAAAMMGLSWTSAFENLSRAFDNGISQLRPTVPRSIAVAVPRQSKSQLGVIDHLRFNDERAAAEGSPSKNPADLCVRFVSLRPNARTALARRDGGPVARTSGASAGLTDSS
jgi:hypothetical protein